MDVTSDKLQEMYDHGLIDPQRLWDNGFRPVSNKYRCASKSWTRKKKHYEVDLTLTYDDYQELKMCGIRSQQEAEERMEREEWERIKYLRDKYDKRG
jgi:hypothetical protein